MVSRSSIRRFLSTSLRHQPQPERKLRILHEHSLIVQVMFRHAKRQSSLNKPHQYYWTQKVSGPNPQYYWTQKLTGPSPQWWWGWWYLTTIAEPRRWQALVLNGYDDDNLPVSLNPSGDRPQSPMTMMIMMITDQYYGTQKVTVPSPQWLLLGGGPFQTFSGPGGIICIMSFFKDRFYVLPLLPGVWKIEKMKIIV